MPDQTQAGGSSVNLRYQVAIDTVPLPENPVSRMRVVLTSFSPAIGKILRDATSFAIGSWPTAERFDEEGEESPSSSQSA